MYTACGLCTSDVSTCHPPVIHHVVQHACVFPRATGWVLLHLLCTHHLHVVRTSDVISSFVREALPAQITALQGYKCTRLNKTFDEIKNSGPKCLPYLQNYLSRVLRCVLVVIMSAI